MYKIFAFLSKREGMTMQQFIDYYENNHVPLICSLEPIPPVYKRRYVVREEEFTHSGSTVDFDVITETNFADKDAFLAWIAKISLPGAGEQVLADETNFLDRSRTRAYVIDEHITSE